MCAPGAKESYQQRMFTEVVILSLDLYADFCCFRALERIGGYPLTMMTDDGCLTLSDFRILSCPPLSYPFRLVDRLVSTLLDYIYVRIQQLCCGARRYNH